MRRKAHNSKRPGLSGSNHSASDADFYSGEPTEVPLYQDRHISDSGRVRKTARHKNVAGRRKETADPREKMALLALLRAGITLVVLMILFFALWKAINIHEERIFMDNQPAEEPSMVIGEVTLADDFNVEAPAAESALSDRVAAWKDAERKLRSAEDLLLRNNIDQAIQRCQEALQLDPTHMNALERLGHLYYEKGMYAESVNAYIRMLSVDPTRSKLQLELLKALDAYGDSDGVIAVADWYKEQNEHNADVQRYLANAYFKKEKYTEAVSAYDRVLKDSPGDAQALDNQSVSYMRLNDYENALETLNKLVEIKLRDPDCYRRMAMCTAQLGKAPETVQVLGKSAHLFGPDTVVAWIRDSRIDPVRLDRSFQTFADSVGGEEFRRYLERVAQTMDSTPDPVIEPQLELPKNQELKPELIKQMR